MEIERNALRDELKQLVLDKKNEYNMLPMIRRYAKQILADSDYLLQFAVEYNETALIGFFIESKCKLDAEDSQGMTPLMNAAMNNDYDNWMVAVLLYNAQTEVIAESLFGASKPPFSFKKKARSIVTQEIHSKLIEKGVDTLRIGAIFAKIRCPREIIVSFKNPDLTAAYFQALPHYNFIDNDLKDNTLRILMKSVDLQHLKIYIDHFTDVSQVSFKIFRLLLEFISNYEESQSGRDFVRDLMRLNIFNEQSVYWLEAALMRANEKSLENFFKHDFRTIVQSKTGKDIMPSIFGNYKVDIASLLKHEKIDVDARGSNGSTPLHFAAYHHAAKNIQLLLNMGANIHALDQSGETPVHWAIVRSKIPWNAGAECLKLLLLAGADPLSRTENNINSTNFFGIEIDLIQSMCTNVIRLLIAQLAFYEALGSSIEPLKKAVSSFRDPLFKHFFEECRQQLMLMKDHKIRVNRFIKLTMFTVITENAENFARYIGDEDRLMIDVCMNDYYERSVVEYYYERLENSIKKIDQIKAGKNKAMIYLSKRVGIDYNHLVINEIVNYLSAKDLLTFIKFEIV